MPDVRESSWAGGQSRSAALVRRHRLCIASASAALAALAGAEHEVSALLADHARSASSCWRANFKRREAGGGAVRHPTPVAAAAREAHEGDTGAAY